MLHNLIQTNKWRFPKRNLIVGDIVILAEVDKPPAYWPLGRVEDVHSNRSGLVQVVTVKTASSTFVRPVTKLIYLPFETQATQAYATVLDSIVWGDPLTDI